MYTIGYGFRNLREVVSHLRGVDILVDVRSSPSSAQPDWNQPQLQKNLGSRYLFLGHMLGGRPADPGCYVDGKVNYPLLRRTNTFNEGINRLLVGMSKGYEIALLCSELDPTRCHRSLAVSEELCERGIDVTHILKEGDRLGHSDMVAQLQVRHHLEKDLLHTPAQLRQLALEAQANTIAYRSGD